MTAPTQEKLKPSGFWYVIGVLLLIGGPTVGVILGVVAVVNAYDDITDLDSVPVDGGGEVTLDDGDYTVYVEGPGVDEFTLFSSSDLEILDPDGNPVDLDLVTGDFTYSTGGTDGKAVLTFTAQTSGSYEVRPQLSGTTSSNIREIAIGPGFGDILGDQVGLIVAAIAIGTIGFILGLVILIVVGVKRGKAKRQRRLAAGGYGGGGYQPPGYQAPGYQQPGYPPPPGAGVPPPGSAPSGPYSQGGYQPPQSPIS